MGLRVSISRDGWSVGFRVTDQSRVYLYIDQVGGLYSSVGLTSDEARKLAADLVHQAGVTDYCEGRTDVHPDDANGGGTPNT